MKWGIYLNEEPLTQTSIETYANFHLAPGTYRILGHAENKSELVLEARAGEVYFIRQRAKMGAISHRNVLDLVDAETGKADIMRCRLVDRGRLR